MIDRFEHQNYMLGENVLFAYNTHLNRYVTDMLQIFAK